MNDMLPIIRQMHDAESDRARAAILLQVPDAILMKHRVVFEQACARAGFDVGQQYIGVRRASWFATRGPDGRHKNALFEEARAAMHEYVTGAE